MRNGTSKPENSRATVPGVESFDSLVVEYQKKLHGFARRMVGNREDAEEIVQDAFVRAYFGLRIMSLDQRRRLRLKAWLYTITLNVARNRLRGKRPVFVSIDASLDLEDVLRCSPQALSAPDSIIAVIALLERAFLQVPAHLRPTAELRFIDGYTQPEIAERFGCPVGTVKSHIHRAAVIMRRTLRAALSASS
jgi:RNA polymerase sigma-70 factor (ECF subfamily)